MTPSSARRASGAMRVGAKRLDLTTGGPAAGRWIPWVFVACFVVVIAVNAILIRLAVGSFSGLAEAHPYQAGLAYNETLAARRAEAALGWSVALTLEPTGEPGRMRLTASLADREGRPLEASAVEAELIRPAAAGHDRRAMLAPEASGRYSAIVLLGLKGQWEVRLDVRSAGSTWRTRQRVMAP